MPNTISVRGHHGSKGQGKGNEVIPVAVIHKSFTKEACIRNMNNVSCNNQMLQAKHSDRHTNIHTDRRTDLTEHEPTLRGV